MEEMIIAKQFKHGTIYLLPHHPQVAVIEATATYIPLEKFKEIFNFIGELTAEKKIIKLIFDKRKLSVFHQPSMEWYFVEWKENMYELGLTTHRKILPSDDVFRECVRIGREKITKTFPQKKFNQMDIQYSKSIQEALDK